jgi:hypothetical protein
MEVQVKLWVHDTRLGGPLPNTSASDTADATNFDLDVNVDAPLSQIVSWIQQQASANNSAFVRLVIACHGFEPSEPPTGAWDSEGQDPRTTNPDRTERFATGGPVQQGGGGLQLGADNLTLANAGQLQSLKGLLDWIELRGCGTAYQALNGGGVDPSGDGKMFCSTVATMTNCTVQASSDTQYTMSDGSLPWWGTVYTFGPNGNVIKVQSAAEANA